MVWHGAFLTVYKPAVYPPELLHRVYHPGIDFVKTFLGAKSGDLQDLPRWRPCQSASRHWAPQSPAPRQMVKSWSRLRISGGRKRKPARVEVPTARYIRLMAWGVRAAKNYIDFLFARA